MPKIYKAWPGRNRFLPCGCIMGPLADMSANLCVYCCILGALIPYCIFVLGDIWSISPVIPILLFLSVIVLIIFLNLTQCTDPGIIPRRTFLQ
jgi:palmitoyltransferase ZDHHC9/14/18